MKLRYQVDNEMCLHEERHLDGVCTKNVNGLGYGAPRGPQRKCEWTVQRENGYTTEAAVFGAECSSASTNGVNRAVRVLVSGNHAVGPTCRP